MLTLAVYNSTPERNKSVYVYLTIFNITDEIVKIHVHFNFSSLLTRPHWRY